MLDSKILEKLRVPPGKKMRLKDHDPGWAQTPGVNSFDRFGVSPRAIRLHVGLEDPEMLWADLENAFKISTKNQGV